MTDAHIISWIDDVTASIAQELTQEGPSKASLIEGRRVNAIISRIIATRAMTLPGLQAKAALYLLIPTDEIAEALADDMVAFT